MMSFDAVKKQKGLVVYVKDDNVEKALRKFKKKIADSGKLQGLREKEFYEKPTTARKKAVSAAKNRWRKKLAAQELPKKLY
jgi:small subunit ribosomal protein S21